MALLGLQALDHIHHYPPKSLMADNGLDPFAPVPSFVDTGVTLIDMDNVNTLLNKDSGNGGEIRAAAKDGRAVTVLAVARPITDGHSLSGTGTLLMLPAPAGRLHAVLLWQYDSGSGHARTGEPMKIDEQIVLMLPEAPSKQQERAEPGVIHAGRGSPTPARGGCA